MDRPITYEIASLMAAVATRIGRQVGVLVSRKGNVEYVVVGHGGRIAIPDTGRFRAGRDRLRGLRFVHVHLRGEPLDEEDLNDLVKLRLDHVGALTLDDEGLPERYHGAELAPDPVGGRITRALLAPASIHAIEPGLLERLREIELALRRFVRGVGVDDGRTRAMLVHLELPARVAAQTQVSVDETVELAGTAGVHVVETIIQRRNGPHARTFVGEGKLEEILQRSMELDVELLIFNQPLGPGQVRAITEATELKVIDRTMLILDIFAERAGSRDGKLLVELAQLRYRAPFLVGSGGAMSRLEGGIGGRGPGETKLEVDRRRIKDRIAWLERQAKRLATRRLETRKRRNARQVPIASLVGYTNAGKSTLLNALTNSEVRARDELFSTLDPTARRLRFPTSREVVLTDTVGFIEHLPPALLAAFRATLEELAEADVLIHVVDMSSPRLERQLEAVAEVLSELGLDDVPRVLVFNKRDRIEDEEVALELARLYGAIAISALEPATTLPLLSRVEEIVWRERQRGVSEVAID